jgi:hypothetical protein
MRFVIATLVIIGALAHFASAQSCPSGSTLNTCSACINTKGYWCSSYTYPTSGCCTPYSGYACPSDYQFFTADCNTFISNPAFNVNGYKVAYCGGPCIAWIIICSLAWIANMCVVFRFCKQRNLEPCGYIAIAFFFGWWVWCCLVPASRRQQLVIVQTGIQQNVPYQSQPVQVAQPGYPAYGQQAYGQQAGYAPQTYPQAQPVNPYTQQPQNHYAQPFNPYAQDGQISKPQ